MTANAATSALLGTSKVIKRVREEIARLAPARLSILLEGPTGSGKELAAEALHAASGRDGAFVALNACAIPDEMFEDTLFGHVRGAFSGAIAEHRGYMAEANGGTLFLDEMGGLALASQVKLLRAIETKRFRPVGARHDASSDFRLVTAINVPLATLLGSGAIRQDLAHRVAGAVLRMPSLRERIEDVEVLARHFLQGERTLPDRELSKGALDMLARHDWPGNVRELRNVVERACALAADRRLQVQDIARALGVERSHEPTPHSSAEFGRRQLWALLDENGWDMAVTARQLGVHRSTLWRRVQRFMAAERAATGRKSDVGPVEVVA